MTSESMMMTTTTIIIIVIINYRLPEIKNWVEHNNPGDLIIPLSVPLEAKIGTMSNSSVESQLPKVILAGYKALDLIHYFTCGPQEVRAWTVRVSQFLTR
jgi:obg-like ATPase 1